MRAAREEVVRSGYPALTIERVAALSGVAKTTIYRWWPTKAHLVIDAIAPVFDATNPIAAGAGASLRADLTRAIQRVSEGFSTHVGHHVIAGLMAECAQEPEVAEMYRDRVLRPRRGAVTSILEHWRAEGEIAPDADLDLAQDMYVGAVFYRALVVGGPLDSTFQDHLVSAVLAVLNPPTPVAVGVG